MSILKVNYLVLFGWFLTCCDLKLRFVSNTFWTKNPKISHCTEVRFASFLSGGFITAMCIVGDHKMRKNWWPIIVKKVRLRGRKDLKKCGDFVYGQPPTLFLLLQSFTFGSHLLAQWTIFCEFSFLKLQSTFLKLFCPPGSFTM